MKQAIAGVAPTQFDEVTVMTVWPSNAAFGIGRILGSLYSINAGFYIFRLGHLVALASIPVAAALFFFRVAPFVGTRYRVTNRRVIVERGISGKEEKSVELDRFDEIEVVVRAGQAWYSAGDLIFRNGETETFRLDGVSPARVIPTGLHEGPKWIRWCARRFEASIGDCLIRRQHANLFRTRASVLCRPSSGLTGCATSSPTLIPKGRSYECLSSHRESYAGTPLIALSRLLLCPRHVGEQDIPFHPNGILAAQLPVIFARILAPFGKKIDVNLKTYSRANARTLRQHWRGRWSRPS